MPDWADRFIDALTLTPNITAAALGAGIDRSHAYYIKSQDADFSRRWDDAIARSLDDLGAGVSKTPAPLTAAPGGVGKRDG